MTKAPHDSKDWSGDVFLCGTRRHLLMALTSILHRGRPATLIYLEDIMPIAAEMRLRLTETCPDVRFLFTSDAAQIAAFARLPHFLPAIIRRNLTIGGPWGLQRPHMWQSPLVKDRRFVTSYVHHSIFFMAKVLSGRANRTVLREDGLGNYAVWKVPRFKALLRWLIGLNPQAQVWGEEPWVDVIEVLRPDDLPEAVRAKGQRLSFAEQMDQLPAPLARALAKVFLGEVPDLAADTQTAIILTQPIDKVGYCTVAQKQALYAGIVARLTQAGYRTYVKPHPTESGTAFAQATILPSAFPIEVWPYLTDQKFTLAVALCSTSLAGDARSFADQAVQLLPASVFNAAHFEEWAGKIATSLDALGASGAGTAGCETPLT